MTQLLLEIVRALFFAGIFAYLCNASRREGIMTDPGYWRIFWGFASILVGMVLDVTENLPSLSVYVIVGDTPVETIVKNMLFFLGFVLLALGISQWIPLVPALRNAQQELTRSYAELEKRVQSRTIDLENANEQLKLEISERKKIEDALRESEQKYRLHFENVNEVIFSYTTQFEITDISPSIERFLGYRPEELVGRRIPDLNILPPEHVSKAAEEARKVFGGERIDASVYQLFARDGTIRFGEISGAPLIKDGEVVGCVSVGRDITERKRMEEELQVAHDELERRVEERTTELSRANEQLIQEVHQRERTEEALRHSEEKYRVVVENAKEAIFLIQEGQVLFVNPSGVVQSGYDQEEILAKPFLEFIHPDDREMVIRNYALRMQGGEAPNRYAFRLVAKGGDVVWTEIDPVVISWEGKPAILTFGTDITERMLAEQILRESEQRLELALDAAELGLWDWNVKTGEIYLDERAVQMLGLAPEEVEPHIRLWEESIHEEDRSRVMEAVQALLESCINVLETEYRMRAQSGEWRWILTRGKITERDNAGNPLRATGTHLDVTHRKRAEKELQESQERFKELAELLPQFVYEINDKGFFTFANRSGLESGGYTSEDLARGLYALDVFGPEEAESLAADIQAMFRGERPSNRERLFRCKDGTTIPVLCYCNPVMSEGQVVGIRGIALDMSERIKAEQEIKASLKEKEVLLREIHHRVKNNLQVISSILGLQSMYLKDEQHRDIFKDAQSRIWSMALVHENLYRSEKLSFIRGRSYVGRLAAQLFSTYVSTPHRVAIETEIEDVSLPLDSAVPFGLILNELLSNCLKHAFPDGTKGTVKISVRSTGEDEIELTVADNGVGIPDDVDVYHPKSFGLDLIGTLVAQIRGEITLDRSSGTAFRIRFKAPAKVN